MVVEVFKFKKRILAKFNMAASSFVEANICLSDLEAQHDLPLKLYVFSTMVLKAKRGDRT